MEDKNFQIQDFQGIINKIIKQKTFKNIPPLTRSIWYNVPLVAAGSSPMVVTRQ